MPTALDHLVLPPAGYWHKTESSVPRYAFGEGAKKDFHWYFQGESKVKVRSLKEICRWLAACEYMSDMELFQERDFWQHPITFEYLRKGDCDDHALWAWRKLSELGCLTEFVSGQWLERKNGEVKETGHAWVHFQDPESKLWCVLEATEKSARKMIVPFPKAEEYYFPEYSVDKDFKTYRFTIAKGRRRG